MPRSLPRNLLPRQSRWRIWLPMLASALLAIGGVAHAYTPVPLEERPTVAIGSRRLRWRENHSSR